MRRRFLLVVLAAALSGCATFHSPYVGEGPHPQIQRGMECLPVDALGNFLALPMKLLLWDWRFDDHAISSATEDALVTYLAARQEPVLNEAVFRLNQYRPGQDLARLCRNHYVAWPYRLLLGLPATLIGDVLLPGRLFPWGDYYNPWNNTVHLYSNHPAIALHEAGHVHDLSPRRWRGTYSACRLIPFVDLYQEYRASDEAITYLERETADRNDERAAYKILYPAYGTYVGSYFFAPIGTIAGALLGHLSGRDKASESLQAERRASPAAAPATEAADSGRGSPVAP